MRMLERNKQELWYANYLSKNELKDSNGYNLGEYELVYSRPQKILCNVGYIESEAEIRAFGVQAIDTICIMMTPEDCRFAPETIIWWGKKPNIAPDGTTNTAHNFRIVGIRPSLNCIRIYAQKITITKAVKQDINGGAP